MKTLILLSLLLILITFNSFGQKWALLDRNRKLPILFTDSVTAEQLNQGFFPIEKTCIDTFTLALEELYNRLEKNTKSKLDNITYPVCSVTFDMNITHLAYGDRYNVFIISNTQPLQTKWKIVTGTEANRINANRLELIIKYLKKNMETDTYRFKKGNNKNEVYKKGKD
jgi:hypothetical protein